MKPDIRLLMVEDEKEVRDKYKDALKNHPMIQLAAETENAEEAICVLKDRTIDAIILDLELQKGSGILLLEKMQGMDIDKPFIAVVTNIISKAVYDSIRSMGVDYICAKTNDDFLHVPFSVIEISAPYRRVPEEAAEIASKNNTRTKINVISRSSSFELHRMGFPEKLYGTQYILDCLIYLSLNNKQTTSLTNELYPYIASKYDTNTSNVERSIRIAIEKVWTEQPIEKLDSLYPYKWNKKTGRPTNAEFLRNMHVKLFDKNRTF